MAEEIRARLVLGQYEPVEKPLAPLFAVYAGLWLENYIKPLHSGEALIQGRSFEQN